MRALGGISLRIKYPGIPTNFQNLRGQATVEAAFALPLIALLLLLLLQPGILLYDRMVMESAAAEGCRLLATHAPAGMHQARVEQLILRRLGAVPAHDLFHVHNKGCSWKIRLQGDEAAAYVSVRIENTVRLLPLINAGAALLGAADQDGCIHLHVERASSTQPEWAVASGIHPEAWTVQRL